MAILRGISYQNNSIVMLEDIGEGDDALLCLTNYTDCCQGYDTGEMVGALGNWYFPNGTKVPYEAVNRISGEKWDFYRDRGRIVVRMHRRRGGGIYHCVIPDAMNVTQTIYYAVYSVSTGEWSTGL